MLTPIVLVLASACAAESPAERVDAYLAAELAASHVPGASVAVVRDGGIVLEKGYGLANVELGVPAGKDTVYELLSVSKQFTATAVMLLVDEGKIALDDRIADRIPGLPAGWKDITVAELLAHASGIQDYTDQKGWFDSIRSDRTPDELIASVKPEALQFAPGSRWRYSNSNYLLLGRLVEILSGEPFDAFVTGRIFAPLEMRSARLESFQEVIPGRAAGYHWGKDGLVNAPWVSPTHKWAAGGFVASAHDLALWALALDARELLRPESHERMLAPFALSDGSKAPYGFANELAEDHGHRVAGHQGGGLAFNTTLLRFVDDRLSVIVLCNLTQAPSKTWARRIASFWLTDLAEAEPAVADADPEFTKVFERVLADAAQGKVDADLFAEDVRAERKAFIERVGPRFLGPLGALESLTPIEAKEQGGVRTLRYRAKFAKGELVWTVEVDRAGRIRSMEPQAD